LSHQFAAGGAEVVAGADVVVLVAGGAAVDDVAVVFAGVDDVDVVVVFVVQDRRTMERTIRKLMVTHINLRFITHSLPS
jgi:hypothetical protein